MEVDEKPTEDYNDIGGLEKQIQEWVETIVLPITHKERFQKFGVGPPKGVLLYGPPGTGKTLIARACAAQTNATFLKLAGPQLVKQNLSAMPFSWQKRSLHALYLWMKLMQLEQSVSIVK
ncbi:hypothetical protein GLYMA_19G232901v4 [Glycine max]|nr:hypothetical protein GLYMA_19G232901v4 [Glycine max]KAH1079210.1 hypothetical protein GYH30_053991 [Glycine max]